MSNLKFTWTPRHCQTSSPKSPTTGAQTYLAIAEWVGNPTNTAVADLSVDL